MKVLVPAASLLLLAGAAHAQTAPAQTATPPATAPVQQPAPTSSVTRDLNSGPPAPATYLAPAPAPRPAAPTTTAPAATSTPAPTTAPPATQPRAAAPAATPPAASPPRTTPPAAAPAPATAAPVRPAATPPAAATAAPTTAPGPRAATPAPTTPPASTPAAPRAAAPAATTPAPAAAPVATPAPPPPSAPALTVLDAGARAALPFTLDLPQGFELVTGRPGPDFRIYTVRRGDRSFAMIYAGPASQFPIYSGEMAEAGGRASVVVAEGSERHAVEHLFQRQTAPREIHVWTMSLDGADRALAERIAQSVDVR